MDREEGHLRIALCGDVIYIKAVGLAGMNNCMSLLELTTALLDKGYYSVVVDLNECIGMDSTFLGVLAAIATHGPPQEGPSVVVINATGDCVKSLDCVGLTRFLEIHPRHIEPPAVETYQLENEDMPDAERVRFIREAHERLLLIDQKNRELFGPLLRMLGNELATRSEQDADEKETDAP